MDREEIMELIRKGPIRVTMNDGSTYDVAGVEYCLVTPISMSVMVKNTDASVDKEWRTHHLPLVTIAGVEELQPHA